MPSEPVPIPTSSVSSTDTRAGTRYNANHWRADWPGFAAFFFDQVFSEPHSTKPIEDMVDWALETDPEVMVAAEYAPYIDPPDAWTASGEPPVLCGDPPGRVPDARHPRRSRPHHQASGSASGSRSGSELGW